MSYPRILLLVGAAALSLASVVPPAGGQGPRGPTYRIVARDVPLARVTEVTSVGLSSERFDTTTLELPGGAVTAVAQHAVGETWKVTLSPTFVPPKDGDKVGPAVQSKQRVALQEEALDALRFHPDVAWAYPAYRSLETGTVLLPTPYLLVQVAPGIDAARLEDELSHLEVEGPLPFTSRQWRLRLADVGQDPLAVSLALTERFAWIEWAEPDFVWQLDYDALPNDPLTGDAWHVSNQGQGAGVPGADARLEAAWDLTTGDGSVVIAIVDDGVQWNHPDLASRIFQNPGESLNGVDDDGNGLVDDVRGWDFRDGDNDPNPDLGGPGSHGTSVAGVAAAAGGNGVGGSGACQDCRILPVRISGPGGFVSNSIIASALNYAASFADVLNNSWAGGSPVMSIMTAVDNALTNGRGGLGAPTLFANGNSASGYRHFSIPIGGFPGNHTFEWWYVKDATVDAGFDTVWLDNVALPDGSLETFEGCTSLPAGWTVEAHAWTAVNDETRSSSRHGGGCSIRAGVTPANNASIVRVSRNLPLIVGAKLEFDFWVSSERFGGTGPIVTDSCHDFLMFWYEDANGRGHSFAPFCGTSSNQGNPLMDGTLSFPSSDPDTISVGGATNFDRRSDYAQWGLDMNGDPGIDFVVHTDGGSLGIVTTDVVGAAGYSPTDYTNGFGGTSSATPLAAGIVGLLLTQEPGLTHAQVRSRLRQATRKIGGVAYSQGYNLVYGHGALDAFQFLTANVVFADGFESGNTSAWSGSVP